jgi:hypothetical protein
MEGFDGGMSEEDFIALTETDLTGIKAGYRSMAAEETNTLADVGRGALHGITDAVDETLQFGAGIQDKFVEDAGDVIGGVGDFFGNDTMSSAKDWDLHNEAENARFINLGMVDKPRTAVGQFVEDIFQFGTGLVGAGKLKVGKNIAENLVLGKGGVLSMSKKEAAKKTTKAKVSKSLDDIESTWLSRNKKRFNAKDPQWRKKRGIDFIDSAVASVVVQDPYEHTLAEVMVENEWVGASLASYLASDLDDSVWERRLKNGVEDVTIGMALLPLFKAFKARNDGKVPDADDLKKGVDEEKVAEAVKLKEATETVESHLNNTTKTDQPTALKINTVIKAAQNDVSISDYLKNMSTDDLRNVVKSVIQADKVVKDIPEVLPESAVKTPKMNRVDRKALDDEVKTLTEQIAEANSKRTPIPKNKAGRTTTAARAKVSKAAEAHKVKMKELTTQLAERTAKQAEDDAARGVSANKSREASQPDKFYRAVNDKLLKKTSDEKVFRDSLLDDFDATIHAIFNVNKDTNLTALNAEYGNIIREVSKRVDVDVSAATKDIEDSLNTVKSHGEYTGEKIIKPEKTFANLSGVKESKGPLKNTAGERYTAEEMDTIFAKYKGYNVAKKMNKEGGCF